MGDELVKMYEKIREDYGEIGMFRLIVKTRISRDFAMDLEDSEQNIATVQKAIKGLGFAYTKGEERKTRRGFLSRFFRRNKK